MTQYFICRLNGPDSFKGAAEIVRNVPTTDMMNYLGFFCLFLLGLVFIQIF